MPKATSIETPLSPHLLERILQRLAINELPELDLTGLNKLCKAFNSNVSNDNIQKRIWLVGERVTPVTGGEPVEFFENWLTHGTGGTCFPLNNALATLACAIGFDARRIAGSILLEEIEQDANHGSVLVKIEGIDYLVDAQFAAFKALPLVPGRAASTGQGIHDIRAVPIDNGFHVYWYAGHHRTEPLIFQPTNDPVSHSFFLDRYEASTSNSRSPFNESLYFCRHFENSILAVGRKHRIAVTADNVVTKTELTEFERRQVLIDELGISEEIASRLPPDVKGGIALAE